jgi:hypothetical protein
LEEKMSDTMPEEPVSPVKPKQYLLMVDEASKDALGRLIPSLTFVQIEGMGMQNNSDHMLLVSPLPKTAVETMPVEAVKAADV